jgi:hypothetical protein
MNLSFFCFSARFERYYCTFYMLYPFLSSVLCIDVSDEGLRVLVR